MDSQEILEIIGFILLFGGTLLAASSVKLPVRKVKVYWRIVLGIPLAGVGLFFVITSSPEYAIGLSVLATLALAFAAFLTIKEADEREERHREEESRIREEEKERDFKRRCLDDIQDWAQKGTALFVEFQSFPLHITGAQRQYRIYLAPLKAMNKWVMDASRTFAEDDKKALLKKVDEAAENLKQYYEVLEGKLPGEGIDQRRIQCLESFAEVLERIADVKVKLRL
jgi:hypothetical protein